MVPYPSILPSTNHLQNGTAVSFSPAAAKCNKGPSHSGAKCFSAAAIAVLNILAKLFDNINRHSFDQIANKTFQVILFQRDHLVKLVIPKVFNNSSVTASHVVMTIQLECRYRPWMIQLVFVSYSLWSARGGLSFGWDRDRIHR
jgi:hypothetical protein